MEIQLKELIDQIKKDGVEAAESEAQAILKVANDEAEQIILSAKAEAKRILQEAKKENERMTKWLIFCKKVKNCVREEKENSFKSS